MQFTDCVITIIYHYFYLLLFFILVSGSRADKPCVNRICMYGWMLCVCDRSGDYGVCSTRPLACWNCLNPDDYLLYTLKSPADFRPSLTSNYLSFLL